MSDRQVQVRMRASLAGTLVVLMAAAIAPGSVQARAADPALAGTAAAPRVTLGLAGKRVALLIVRDVTRGQTVRVRCLKGCRKRWSTRRTARRTSVRLALARKGRVRVGSQVEVAAFTKAAGGIYRAVTVRRNGVREIGAGCIGGNGRRAPCAAPAPPPPPAAEPATPAAEPVADPTPTPTPSKPPGDTTKPTKPTGLSAAPAQYSIALSWAASTDNIGVTGYSVYLNSGKVADVSARSHNFAGLNCATSYTLGVVAYDGAGNRSDMATVAATTTACPAPPPPPPPTVSISKGGYTAGCCHWVNVSWANFSAGGHTVVCRASHGDEGGFYSYGVSGSSGSAAGCYYGYPSRTVWVTVDGVASNQMTGFGA